MAATGEVPLGPARVNVSGVRAGDRNTFDVTIRPINLAGLTIEAQARLKSTTPEPAMVAEVEVLDAAAGKVRLIWPGEQVRAALGAKSTWTGVWDLQVSTGPDDVFTVCAGTFRADMDVTRSSP